MRRAWAQHRILAALRDRDTDPLVGELDAHRGPALRVLLPILDSARS